MVTTVHARFTVTCSVCGFLSAHKNFGRAVFAAQSAYLRHTLPEEKIEIFDVMAQRGCPELWNFNGDVLARRGQGDGRSD
jgi:hypothetical protein